METKQEQQSAIDKLYMEWVEWFCEKNSNFSSDLYKYNNEGVSKITIENVAKLEKFFREIEIYAEENNINPDMVVGDFIATKSYYLKYKDVTYVIGYICDHSTIFYCSTALSEISPEKIIKYEDFEKTLNTKKVVAINKNENKKTKTRIRKK
ncbi:MAG: hypothetical protein ACI4PE_01830 [Bacilli bacterium]